MIGITDIHKSIANRLRSGGNEITAGEVTEGFEKPTCFIEIAPAETESQGAYYDMVTLNIEIKYYPKIETKIECLKKAEELKSLLLSHPILVADRSLNIENLIFDVEATVLICEFEISFYQSSAFAESIQDSEVMQNLNFK